MIGGFILFGGRPAVAVFKKELPFLQLSLSDAFLRESKAQVRSRFLYRPTEAADPRAGTEAKVDASSLVISWIRLARRAGNGSRYTSNISYS